jgi:predicted nuclease of predicted toxin-antitoxin system
MKIKLDENLPIRLKSVLARSGYDTDTVIDEGLGGKTDAVIWQAAQSEQRFLITQDLDFSDMRTFKPGTHCGILLLRLHEPSSQALLDRVAAVAEEIKNWQGCFVVLTEHKLRIKRPE